LVHIDLDFDAYDWLHREFGNAHLRWEQALKRSDFKIDLGLDLSNVETICLELDWTIPQSEQLQPFIDLPSLKAASISELSVEGAKYILESKTRWPKSMEFYFQDDVPEKLREKLELEFEVDHVDDLMLN